MHRAPYIVSACILTLRHSYVARNSRDSGTTRLGGGAGRLGFRPCLCIFPAGSNLSVSQSRAVPFPSTTSSDAPHSLASCNHPAPAVGPYPARRTISRMAPRAPGLSLLILWTKFGLTRVGWVLRALVFPFRQISWSRAVRSRSLIGLIAVEGSFPRSHTVGRAGSWPRETTIHLYSHCVLQTTKKPLERGSLRLGGHYVFAGRARPSERYRPYTPTINNCQHPQSQISSAPLLK